MADSNTQTAIDPAELKKIRAELEADQARLLAELAITEQDIARLVSDSGDGLGDDIADAGSKTYEREQEMSLVTNAQQLLSQNRRALARIDAGTYGICESCSVSISPERLRAFPRVTLCLTCKEAEERRA